MQVCFLNARMCAPPSQLVNLWCSNQSLSVEVSYNDDTFVIICHIMDWAFFTYFSLSEYWMLTSLCFGVICDQWSQCLVDAT